MRLVHTPREYAHLPFERTFSNQYPEWLGKNDLAKGYQEWVNRYGIVSPYPFLETLSHKDECTRISCHKWIFH